LGQEERDLNGVDLKTFSVKYLGITDGKIGILSRKLPLTKHERQKSLQKEERKLSNVKSVPSLQTKKVQMN